MEGGAFSAYLANIPRASCPLGSIVRILGWGCLTVLRIMGRVRAVGSSLGSGCSGLRFGGAFVFCEGHRAGAPHRLKCHSVGAEDKWVNSILRDVVEFDDPTILEFPREEARFARVRVDSVPDPPFLPYRFKSGDEHLPDPVKGLVQPHGHVLHSRVDDFRI